MSTSATLARRILAAMPEMDHDPRVELHLAIALSRGLGIVRDPRPGHRQLYIVLASPLEATPLQDPHHVPMFLVGAESLAQRRRRAYSTKAVAKFFRRRALHLGPERPEGYTRRWAAAATRSLAVVPIDGDLPSSASVTPDVSGFDDNQYEWFNLDGLPVGSIVYRVDSTGTLYLFQRLSATPGYWSRFCLRVTTDVVDVYGMVVALRNEHGGVLELDAVPGEIPLMRQPPQFPTKDKGTP